MVFNVQPEDYPSWSPVPYYGVKVCIIFFLTNKTYAAGKTYGALINLMLSSRRLLSEQKHKKTPRFFLIETVCGPAGLAGLSKLVKPSYMLACQCEFQVVTFH